MGLLHPGFGFGVNLENRDKTKADKKLARRLDEFQDLYEYVEDNYPLLELEFCGYIDGRTTYCPMVVVIRSTHVETYDSLVSINLHAAVDIDVAAERQLTAFMVEFDVDRQKEWLLWAYFSP